MADASGTGFDELIAKLQLLEETAHTTGLQAAGISLLTSAQKKITDGGSGWPPWSKAYADRIAKHGPQHQMLWMNGILLRSLTFGGPGNVWNQTENEITLGSNVSYAARQNYGGGGIPSRLFLDTDADSMQLAQQAFVAQLIKVLDS